MNLVSLELDGFKSFRRRTEIVFQPEAVTYVVSENFDAKHMNANGAGKTSILDAICWALYGKLPSGMKKDALINNDRKGMWVRLTLDGAIIERWKDRNKSEGLKFRLVGEGDWKDVETEKSLDLTQKALEELVCGISFDAFCNIVYLSRTSEVVEFLRATPSKRVKILSELVGDKVFVLASKLVSDKIKNIESEVSVLSMKNEQAGILCDRIQGEVVNIKQVLDQEQEERDKITAKRAAEIAECHAHIRRLQAFLQEKPTSTLEKINDRLTATESRIRHIDQHIAELRYVSKMNALRPGSPCPTCRREVSHMDAAELNQKRMEAEQALMKTERLKKEELENLSDLKDKREQHQNLEASRDKARKDIKQFQSQVLLLEDQAIPQQDSFLRTRLMDLTKEMSELNVQIADRQSKMSRVCEDLPVLEDWKKAFGKEIRDMLFDQVRAGLNYHANNILKTLFGATYKLDCPTTDKDEFSVLVFKGEHAMDIRAFSGGEQFRLQMGVLLALGKTMLASKICPFQFRLLDEMGEGLDEKGREVLKEHLQNLVDSGEVTSVLTTLPREDLAIGEHTIKVVIKNKESSLA